MRKSQITNLKYPYSYKGITKVFLSEILNVLIEVVAIVFLILRIDYLEGSSDGTPAGAIIIAVLSILTIVIYLAGLVQARKEEKEFRLALIITVIALISQIVAEALMPGLPIAGEWIEFACEILELIAFEGVVTGVVTLARHIGDERIISIGKKMRILVTLIWIAVIAGKIMEFISSDVSENVRFAGDILEIIDHVFYMILLVKGRKMLALSQR